MKITFGLFFGIFLLGLTKIPTYGQNKLFYHQPAKNWVEALPMGNGRLGVMVYGGVSQEHLQFNEETLWTGKPRNYAHKGASKYLAEIRKLLFEGKQIEAQELMAKEFMSEPRSLMAYQPFGDLIINFPDHQDHINYSRELDLENAIHKVSYQVGEINYTREVFVSHSDQLIAIKLTSDKAKTLDFNLYLGSAYFKKSVYTNNDIQTLDVLPGKEPQRFTGVAEESVLFGQAGLKVITDGRIIPHYKEILVSGATTATIYLTAFTNFVNYRDVSGNPQRKINQSLQNCVIGL